MSIILCWSVSIKPSSHSREGKLASTLFEGSIKESMNVSLEPPQLSFQLHHHTYLLTSVIVNNFCLICTMLQKICQSEILTQIAFTS